MATVHVIGAGLAGLACAVRLAGRGRSVHLYEAAPHAGGRCRSFHDRQLGRTIDNGNHLLLSGNRAALAYLAAIGAADTLHGPPDAAFPFVDLATGQRWTVRPNRGWLPWWILAPRRRVPGARALDHLAALRLAVAGPAATVADVLGTATPLYHAFWEPLAVAALNTPADRASARLLAAVIAETFARGGDACRPLIARNGLGASFVAPALAFLERRGVPITLNRRLRAIATDGGRAVALDFGDGPEPLGDGDAAVLALPPGAASALLPGLAAPTEDETIVNGHFVLDRAEAGFDPTFLGLIGGTAQWLFRRGDVVSVTVSAAGPLADMPAEAIGPLLWADTAKALGLDRDRQPPTRIIKERRATFSQTADQAARRPKTRIGLANLVLAGDWTATGLPATIEGAIRSGHAAADAL